MPSLLDLGRRAPAPGDADWTPIDQMGARQGLAVDPRSNDTGNAAAIRSFLLESARAGAPNLTSLAMGEPQRPQQPMPAVPGKIEQSADPRMGGAIPEILALGAGGPGGMAMRAATRPAAAVAEHVMPRLAAEAAPVASRSFPTEAAGLTAAGVFSPTDATAASTAKRQVIAAPKAAAPAPAGPAASETPAAGLDPRQAEIDRLSQSIAAREGEVVRLGTTRTPSPAGTQASTIDALRGGLARDTERLRALHDELGKEKRDADALNTRNAEEQKTRDAQRRQAEAPFRDRFPIAAQVAPFVGPAAAALTGLGIGKYVRSAQAGVAADWEKTAAAASKALSREGGVMPGDRHLFAELAARQARGLPYGNSPALKAMAGGAGMGALEGGLVPWLMTEYDAQSLPLGSEHQAAATAALADPAWYASRVLPGIAAGALIGGTAGNKRAMHGGAIIAPVEKTEGILSTMPKNATAPSPANTPKPKPRAEPKADATPAGEKKQLNLFEVDEPTPAPAPAKRSPPKKKK